jgi:hypothetical protein
MFHKIKNVAALPEYKLSVQFSEGVTKIYDVKPLFERIPLFAELNNNYAECFEDYLHNKTSFSVSKIREASSLLCQNV